MSKFTREYQLSEPVRAWMERQGYEVRAEVRDCDLLGRKTDLHGDPVAHAVELKLGATEHLLRQARWRSAWANFVTIAIPVVPDIMFLGDCREYGYGLLIVEPSGRVRVKLHPRPQPWKWQRMRKVSEKHLNKVWKNHHRKVGGVSPRDWKAMG